MIISYSPKNRGQKIFTDYGENVGYGMFITKHLNRVRFRMNGRAPGYSSYLGDLSAGKFNGNNVVKQLCFLYLLILVNLFGALVLNEPFERLNLTNKAIDAFFCK
ncbi:MAG: hypothetical protein WKF59_17815 [Chitinophagaceae bacterium]